MIDGKFKEIIGTPILKIEIDKKNIAFGKHEFR